MYIEDLEEAVTEIGSLKSVEDTIIHHENSLDAKRVLVGAGARVLFYPTLLYNVFRNMIQAEFRWWDEVDEYILLGAVPFPKDVPRLKQLGVQGVITLNEPYETLVPTALYKAHDIDHLVIPTRDYLFAPSFSDICRAVDFIHRNASCRKTTYVHCKAGRGRSTTIVLCYLVEHRKMTPAAAFEYVRSSRPRVLLAASQWQAVQDYHRRRENRLPLIKTPASLLAESSDSDNLPESSNNWSESGDRSIVLVTDSDLEGYGPEQAGLVGNDLWAELGLACRVRLVARSAVSGVGLVRFSTLWLGCRVGAKISPEKLVMAGKLAGNPAMEGMDIPVF